MAKKKATRKTAKKSAKKARATRVARRAATESERGGRVKAQQHVAGTCPMCGTANEADMRFCGSCGAGLFEPCPSCGRESRIGVRFCGGCGVEVEVAWKEKQADEARRAELKRQADAAFVAAGGVLDLGNGVSMRLIEIKPGRFTMGSPASERYRRGDETQHAVTISKPFWLGQTELTQAQWQAVMGSNPSRFKGDLNRPVERVSWNDAQEFCRRLSQSTGMTFRLPTEAEWEYACRAGATTAYSFGDDPGRLDEYAWFKDNSGVSTHPVGTRKPNAWALYDMHGNVWEWCEDWYGDYPSGVVTDPQGPRSGTVRVLRGGSWRGFSQYCRAAYRIFNDPGSRLNVNGFRVARTP